MTGTIVERLADFSAHTTYAQLPPPVVEECKRILLDSIGCALGGIEDPKGRIGIDYGRLTGGPLGQGPATVIGTGDRLSIFGASFANGELISALDADAVLPPGHVTPYVLPGAMAVGESLAASGQDLLTVIATSHEMSYRIGKAMDYLRDIQDGKVTPPKVYGYSSTIFGATAAIARLKGMSPERTAAALGIAGSIAPVNSHRAWCMHAPSTTIKYLMAGVLVQSALTAAHMGEMGHRGDIQMLDEPEFGFPRLIGSTRWESSRITPNLGQEWLFPAEATYKPYPHCRILHALLDCEIAMLQEHDIQPSEIESIQAWVEGFVMQPIWLLRDIQHTQDAQFSIAHGLAMGAQRIPPGKAWQDPKNVFSPSVLQLMDKVSFEVHPQYEAMLQDNAASRPARIEIKARGQTFVRESRYPKGSPSPDPTSLMTTEELAQKFRVNAEGVLPAAQTERLIDAVLNLERVADFGAVMRDTCPAPAGRGVGAAPAPVAATA